MKIVTYQGERTLSELTHRVFDIRGRKAIERTRQAESALRRANPHLHDLKKLPAGTPVIVPDVPGIGIATNTPGLAVEEEVMAQLRQALAWARLALSKSIASESQDVKLTNALVASRELAALVKQMPDLADRLAQIAKEAKSQQADITARSASQIRDLSQLEKDFGQFSG